MPISLSVLTKCAAFLQNGSALEAHIQAAGQQAGLNIPVIAPEQVVLTAANTALADGNMDLSYPRVCLHVSSLKNNLAERFLAFSGTASLDVDVWASASLITDCEEWLHYYVDAVTSILTGVRGDWGEGVYFSGLYEVAVQAPKQGGLGFVQLATITYPINVSQ